MGTPENVKPSGIPSQALTPLQRVNRQAPPKPSPAPAPLMGSWSLRRIGNGG
jgi:hypothetical protein